MEKNYTAVSLFSGCGGFDLGVKQAGVEIVWANDIDAHAAKIYKTLFPEVDFVLNDIRNIKKIPRADILIGCYPCTGFSVAARRRWKNKTKRDLKMNEDNFLYKEFVRALSQVNPKYFFIENVSGMLSAKNGWFFDKQISSFEACGYKVKAAPITAEIFGVPQTRRRIFIVGVRSDLDFEYEFPKPQEVHYKVLRDVIYDMPEWPEGEFFDYKFHGHYLTRNRKRCWDNLSYTIVANAHHIPLHPMGKPMKYLGKDKWALQGKKNRRLSWKECAIIQGLPLLDIPPETLPSLLNDKYKVIGNAVPPLLAKALIREVLDF